MSANRPFGLLGRTLGHSYTPLIYHELAGLDYVRFEREPDEVEAFLAGGAWEGVNVTIPYKRTVMAYLDELSDVAERLGNVNTIVRLPDGRLRGDNTDYFGFRFLLDSTGVEVRGKTALVLGGSGGAGSTVMRVLADAGADPVSVGRTGAVTYRDLPRYADAALLVNCTPVGMYPSCPAAPCTLDGLDGLEAVIDIVYNPARTALMMEAERRAIPCAGGLAMLVAQAAQAVERYTGQAVDAGRIASVTAALSATEQNIALIGMPGSGKTRVGAALARLLGREHVDADHVLAAQLGESCASFIEREGEDAFRIRETACLAELSRRSGIVLSCGGGVVTREGNYPLLHQNSLIVMLDRPLGELSSKGRPLSARDGVEKLAAERMGRYRAWADIVVASRESARATASAVAAQLPAMIAAPHPSEP